MIDFFVVGVQWPLRDIVRMYVTRVLRKNHGSVSRTARELGIRRSTLQRMVKRWRRDDAKKGTTRVHVVV